MAAGGGRLRWRSPGAAGKIGAMRQSRDRSAARAAVLLLAPLALLATPLAAQRPLDATGMLQLRRVGELALSPDGAHLLYTVRSVDVAANRSTAMVWILATDGRSRPEVVEPGSSPLWRDAQRFSFVAGGRLVTRTRDGDSRTAVDLPEGAGNLDWSPDGATLSFTRSVVVDPPVTAAHPDLPQASARAYDDLMVRHWDSWRDGSYSHLFVMPVPGDGAVDLLAGERVHTPLPPFGGGEQIAWSPDGKELCYTARRVANPEASTDSSLWVVPVGGGEHRNLTDGLPGYDQDPVYSPDGRWIAFGSMSRAGFEADRLRLMLHDRQSGANRELLPDLDASVHDVVWSKDSRWLYFTVEIEGTTQVYRAALADGKAEPVTRGRHALSALQLHPSGQALFALRSTMERPNEVVRIDVADGSVHTLTDENGAVFAELALPSVDAEWFEATDGKKVHAWILKPPGFDPNRRYPFVLYCQGGPQSMIGQGFSYRWNFHLMAAQGYVVAAVNRRGLPGFGQAWNDQISRDWGGQAMADLLSVADAMRARPYVDRARCAAVGASFGGYSVYWLMGNAGDRFACMISHCGVFNLESMYLATEELFFVDHDLGGPFWRSDEVAAGYQRFSPHRYVQNWRTPLLVIHGERDYRVPYDQGLQAFTAAQVQGVPSRLLTFPGEGHWVLSPQNSLLWHREFYGWLQRHCGADAK